MWALSELGYVRAMWALSELGCVGHVIPSPLERVCIKKVSSVATSLRSFCAPPSVLSSACTCSTACIIFVSRHSVACVAAAVACVAAACVAAALLRVLQLLLRVLQHIYIYLMSAYGRPYETHSCINTCIHVNIHTGIYM